MDFLSLVKPDRDTLESKGRSLRALGIALQAGEKERLGNLPRGKVG